MVDLFLDNTTNTIKTTVISECKGQGTCVYSVGDGCKGCSTQDSNVIKSPGVRSVSIY